jgi:Transposase DDE domain group 1
VSPPGTLPPGDAAGQRLGQTEPSTARLQQQRAAIGTGVLLIELGRRQSGKIRHAVDDLMRQRLYSIACGYPDGNNASRLGADPIQKLLCGRDPLSGEDLASQPTLSRFESAFDRADLHRMGIALADSVIERHRRLKHKVKRITIELDPTDDPTHGAQQLAFYNGHYDSWCYLPVAGFLTFNDQGRLQMV